jgi:hypothetical protein
MVLISMLKHLSSRMLSQTGMQQQHGRESGDPNWHPSIFK